MDEYIAKQIFSGDDEILQREFIRISKENMLLKSQLFRLRIEMKRMGWREEDVIFGEARDNDNANGPSHLNVDEVFIEKKDPLFPGMVEYFQEDEEKILKALILELKPGVALSAEVKCLPAWILFMMIRYLDRLNDDHRMRSLLTSVLTSVKGVMQRNVSLDVAILWLSNILRLLHCLKQYSGDDDNFQTGSSGCLVNFDLSEYCQVLRGHAAWIYVILTNRLQEDMEETIIPAVLENTARLDLGIMLVGKLDMIHDILQKHGLDLEVIKQIFMQLFYCVSAGVFNAILTRKELCTWTKGREIRGNLGALEEWGRRKGMDEDMLKEVMKPVVEVTKIMHARKRESADVGAICDLCESLSVQQVVQLLNMFTSKDGPLSREFIDSVQRELSDKERKMKMMSIGKSTKCKTLLMDIQYKYPVQFHFTPSSQNLEEINIPNSFGISQWIKTKMD